MRKSQDIIGLPIIHVSTGKRLGAVRDVLFDRNQQFQGLLVEAKGWMKRGKYLPAADIRSLGEDAVIANHEKDIRPLDLQAEKWVGLLTGQSKLKGRTVLMADGSQLGMVEEVYLGHDLGTLWGYELSEGFFNDLMEGRKVIRPQTPLTWGEDVLIADDGHSNLL
ncbi:PRC-barrel domain-containing protein [Desmospora profundinema]|uniref:Uncharacterized protein YrrD n=1 Tax=Desmospora profundinema TaxID=1571184 RepID=A0ABU1IK86_9BACL|nr:PRC-barrel domain-containing protein [Desmospora profundinema]MDR6225197.1 uncharacterized protein YrrD [Desmospora profundinema]